MKALILVGLLALSGCAIGVGLVAIPITEVATNAVSDGWKAACDEINGTWVSAADGGPECEYNLLEKAFD